MPLPTVCIVGRPNVGKSTLFNRILRRRQAVVDPRPGVTRDRHYAVAEWGTTRVALVDTGGLVLESAGEVVDRSGEAMQHEIATQAKLAIQEADLVLFLLDGVGGVQKDDEAIARLVLRSRKPSITVVNKIDDERRDLEIFDFTRLGPAEPIGVSAMTGRGMDELLDLIAARLPTVELPAEEDKNTIRLAIVGRPNVGKSSLVNQLVGATRMIVSPLPGTTRDAIDTPLEWEGQRFELVDTAGLRRSARVKDQVEFYTTLRSIKAIHRADVACLVLDAAQELSTQDFRIASVAEEAGCGLLFAVNKWDLIEKDTDTAGAYAKDLKARGRSFAWAPAVFLSALTGQRAARTLELASRIAAARRQHVPTRELNQTVLVDMTTKPPPAVKGHFIKINYVAQGPDVPPTFAIFCNHPELIGVPYQRYVQNRIRERFGFEGVPIRLRFRKKGK